MANPREEWSRLNTLLDTAAVAVSGCGYPVSRIGVVHGEVVWDECCEGYLYIRVMQNTRANPFPQASTAPTTCSLIPTAQVELGILRCAPVMDDNGVAPSAAEQSEFAQTAIRDKSILYHVLMSHYPDWAKFPVVIDKWTPLNIQGGCGGGAWQFYIDVALCPCGPE